MKFRAITVILCIVLLLSVAGNVLVYATIDNDEKNVVAASETQVEAQNIKDGEKFIRENIAEQKEFALYGKADVATYENSAEYRQDRVFDYYVSDTYRYTVNNRGELVGWYDMTAMNADVKVKEKNTEEQTVDIARKVVDAELDIEIDDFELSLCYFNVSSKIYYLTFSKVYNDFVTADSVAVNLTDSGTVIEVNATWYGVFEDFDVNCIKGLTKDKIEDYVKVQILPTFSEVSDYEIKDILLRKINGEYVLELSVEVEYEADGVVNSVLNSWYYEI